MLDIFRVSPQEVATIEWQGDPLEYDVGLSQLGQGANRFLVVNPAMEKFSSLINSYPETEKCVIWNHDEQWVAKQFTKNWTPDVGYEEIEIKKPKFIWRKNPDLDRTMTFEDDPFGSLDVEPWDWCYELVWYIDPRFNPLEDKVWALSCKPISGTCLGVKDMGYVIPAVNVEINDEIPEISLDLDSLCPAYWDLAHENAYMLDKAHSPDRDLWVVKFTPAYRKPKEWKWYGTIEPDFEVEFNPDLPELDYDFDYVIPWHDIGYDHVWFLDRKHLQNNEEDIWAFKIITAEKSLGTKNMGYVSPSFRLEQNPDLPEINFDIDEYVVPWYDFKYDHVWNLGKEFRPESSEALWAVKMKIAVEAEGDKFVSDLGPKRKTIFNPELPKLDYDIDYTVPYYDFEYEHVWLLDKKHYPETDYDIWAVKVSHGINKGTKIMGTVSPIVHYEFNPHLPNLTYDVDYTIPLYDFEFEHTWMLDQKHTKKLDEKMWAFAARLVKNPKGYKEVGSVSPCPTIEVNNELRGYSFPVEPLLEDIQYYDFKFENVYMLDNEYSSGFDIWAVKATYTENHVGSKKQAVISPGYIVEYNPSLEHLKFKIDYTIPYHDSEFIHVWYLDPSFTDGEKIWAAKMYTSLTASGEKELGYIVPEFPEYLDVIFISYEEPNAEENWIRVRDKAPWAKRVKNVKGIFEAHKEAMRLATTDMFYVVDGDAWIVDDFNFDFQPEIFDRDCNYIWYSKNPITDMVYGYGGVKLFSKSEFKKIKKWTTLDLFTSMPKLKVINDVSNLTKFNTDEFSTWRSAFRECVKLCYNIDKFPDDPSHNFRLQKWKNSPADRNFGSLAVFGACEAEKFYEEHKGTEKLNLINDRDWLFEKFSKLNQN